MAKNRKLSSDPRQVLDELYARVQSGDIQEVDDDLRNWIHVIADNSESQKGVLSVFISLLLKKIVLPEQDIRLHQEGMSGGFSARGFDTRHVTPFLRDNNFPYMIGGAGALTRSLEQPVPYNMEYPGKVRLPAVKSAFLNSINAVQVKNKNAKDSLVCLLSDLMKYQQRRQNIKLIHPHNKHIREVVEKLKNHFDSSGRGASRLPVLAIYAVYKQMIAQMGKYQNCTLCELQAHQSADSRSGALGDIQVNRIDGTPFEVVEIKHGISLTPDITMDCYRKFQQSQVEIYYLLSTHEKITDSVGVSNIIITVQNQHGCQMIVNGIITTLRYYLRLIKSVDQFISDYTDLVGRESTADIKEGWNRLWEE